MTYSEWIQNKLASGDPWNQCREWTEEMLVAFPELQRVRGQVILSNGWERDHWWLIDQDGKEVDPTAKQFEGDYFGGSRVVAYFPVDENEPEPTGKCPNCGEYCYNGGTCCSDACHHAYLAYVMGH